MLTYHSLVNMSNNDKSNKGMFSQENIQATLLPEPRYSARLEAKGKSRKPTSSNSEDVNSVVIAPHSSRSDITVGESQRGRHKYFFIQKLLILWLNCTYYCTIC